MATGVICLAGAAHQAWSANLFTTVSDMFPKKAIASVTGIGGLAGGIGGVLVQLFAGFITDLYAATPTVAYGIMFGVCAFAYLIACFLYFLRNDFLTSPILANIQVTSGSSKTSPIIRISIIKLSI